MSLRAIKTISSKTSLARADIWLDERANEYLVRFYNGKGRYMRADLDVYMDSLDGAIKTGQMFVDIF